MEKGKRLRKMYGDQVYKEVWKKVKEAVRGLLEGGNGCLDEPGYKTLFYLS